MIELKHLKCFLAVAEELHFGRAAAKLNMDQSPLSRAIKELEVELGVSLFVRNAKKTAMTQEGELYLKSIKNIFSLLSQAKRNVKLYRDGYLNTLRIATSECVDGPRFSTLLRSLRENEPQLSIELFEVPLSEQLQGIQDDIYDLAFTQTKICSDTVGVQSKELWQSEVVVLLPKNSVLLDKYSKIPIKEIMEYPLVLPSEHKFQGFHKQLETLFFDRMIYPETTFNSNSLFQLCSLVGAGFGLSLVPKCLYSNIKNDAIMSCEIDAQFYIKTYMLHSPCKNNLEKLMRYS